MSVLETEYAHAFIKHEGVAPFNLNH